VLDDPQDELVRDEVAMIHGRLDPPAQLGPPSKMLPKKISRGQVVPTEA